MLKQPDSVDTFENKGRRLVKRSDSRRGSNSRSNTRTTQEVTQPQISSFNWLLKRQKEKSEVNLVSSNIVKRDRSNDKTADGIEFQPGQFLQDMLSLRKSMHSRNTLTRANIMTED